MMKKLVYIVVAVTLAGGSVVLADDVTMPPWRGDPNSTYQLWEFTTDNLTPPPDVVRNDYGTPTLTVIPCSPWIDVDQMSGRQGIWPLSGLMHVWIPNVEIDNPYKWMWLQLTWKQAYSTPIALDDKPLLGITPGVDPYKLDIVSTTGQLPNGWMYSLYKVTLEPNPPWEWVTISGDILVDQLAIDTKCVPEPATVLLLGLGTLVLLRKPRA